MEKQPFREALVSDDFVFKLNTEIVHWNKKRLNRCTVGSGCQYSRGPKAETKEALLVKSHSGERKCLASRDGDWMTAGGLSISLFCGALARCIL